MHKPRSGSKPKSKSKPKLKSKSAIALVDFFDTGHHLMYIKLFIELVKKMYPDHFLLILFPANKDLSNWLANKNYQDVDYIEIKLPPQKYSSIPKIGWTADGVGEVGHAAAAQHDGADIVLVAGPPALVDDPHQGGIAVLLQVEHRDLRGANPPAVVGEAVLVEQVLGDDAGAPQGGDDGEAGADQGGHVEGGLGDTDHRRPGQLAGGQQAGVTETGDHVGIGALALPGQHLLEHADRTDGLVEVALDGDWPMVGMARGDAGAG